MPSKPNFGVRNRVDTDVLGNDLYLRKVVFKKFLLKNSSHALLLAIIVVDDMASSFITTIHLAKKNHKKE